MLPKGRFHPFELDTFGLGRVLVAAARSGATRCLLGIGGSATNDAGFGLARSLGWRFLNSEGRAIHAWTDLDSLREIAPPESPALRHMRIVVATDVQNPLLGPRGATRVYGPQKGIRPTDVAATEACLKKLAGAMARLRGEDHSRRPGAGAAGGLGFGLVAFFGAGLDPGFALFAHHAGLEHLLDHCDLVLTGEGSIDASTFMGKAVGELAHLAQQRHLPCIAFGGQVRPAPSLPRAFVALHALTPHFVPAELAFRQPAQTLARLATRVASHWPPHPRLSRHHAASTLHESASETPARAGMIHQHPDSAQGS
jgi:glycerate 2-kinase